MRKLILYGKMSGMIVFFLVLIMAAGIAENERTDASGQWTYVLEETGVTITDYAEEPSGELAIPGDIDGYPVTGIGVGVFAYCRNLRAVTIPEAVTSIGDFAFYECVNLVAVYLPAGVADIGSNAFFSCAIADLTIPESLTSISEFAFAANDFASIMIPEGVRSIGDSAFAHCENLTSVTLPRSVSEIGPRAFLECLSVTDVRMPYGLRVIDDAAFQSCIALARLTIPPSLNTIGYNVFDGCSELALGVSRGSIAEYYAAENGIPFEYIPSFPTGKAATANQASNQETTTIAVSTAEEFVNAIGSNTTIILSDGEYNLSRVNQGVFSTEEKYWAHCGDFKDLWVMNVHNLIIKGESPGCRIVVDPSCAEVLTFLYCSGITIENVTAGHTTQAGSCEGGVFWFEECADIRINNAHMYGCGAYGLSLTNVGGVAIENSSIYECTAMIMSMEYCHDISFTDCVFRDMESYGGVIIGDAENVTFDQCQFFNLEGNSLFEVTASSKVVVKNSSFINNAVNHLDPSRLVRFADNAFTGNLFDDADQGRDASSVPADPAASLNARYDSTEAGATPADTAADP